ncbi:MAG TPA: hypothetical protein PKE63_06030 [Lacibacter sp.]|mgnify:CR=1 FL=1|nr:hypothetical protein [Lacibacter sp.]HMO88088.1 hypothetical protein [Lacibacter sp.]HMP86817.1 hypothetical protein [Lacibacter sp.]
MKKIFTIICLLITLLTRGQETVPFRSEGTIGSGLVDFSVDNLGNYYLLTRDNQLKKHSNRGDSMGVFNEVRRYGKLYSLEVTNPLKCLLYYRNFSTIVVLDRFLNTINTVDLRRQQIFQVKAIAQSYDNRIWIYDEQNNKLKKVADDGSLLMQTVDLRTIFDEVPAPVRIVDQEGYVYAYDPVKGMYVFDIYGSFKTRISFTGLRDFHVLGKTIYALRDDHLFVYTMGTLEERRVQIPGGPAGVQKMAMIPGHLYLLREGRVEHFTF